MYVSHIFTRAQLTAALTEAGYPRLAENFYASRPYDRGAPRTLTFDYSTPADLAVFLTVAGDLLSSRGWALEFAGDITTGLPGHPDCRLHMGAQWPSFVLDEPTPEEWWDVVNSCADCEAAEGTCPTHEHAPWEPTASLAGV